MPWQVNFIQDTDISGVGIAFAIYINTGISEPLIHSNRVNTNNTPDINDFCNQAEDMLDGYVSKKNNFDQTINKFLVKLNKEI